MIGDILQKSDEEEPRTTKEASVPIERSGCVERDLPPLTAQTAMSETLIERYPETEREREIYIQKPGELISIGSKGTNYSENRYKAIVENSMDNIYICEVRTGRIIESNRSMQQLLGYSRGEMKELTAFDFLDHSRGNVGEYIGQIMETGHLKIKNRRYMRKDGSLVDIEATCCLIKENDKDLICVVSRDITERIEHEKMLIEERNRAELYLDILCHDIGNLHQGIMGFVKLGKEKKEDPIRLRSCIERIDALAMRSVNLANNLKVLAGIGSAPDEIVEFDLEPMINSCIKSVISSIPGKDPEFDLVIPQGISILANSKIEYAFFNVIHNAVKYQIRSDPRVEVSCRIAKDSSIRISVKDRGGGIPVSLRKEVFNRDNLSKKHGGLGLLVVRSLVERSGGSVWIEDQDNAEGTVVIIELPLVK